MQRHFSNRGEKHPEVTAARVLAGRQRLGKPVSTTQSRRPASSKQWFSQVAEMSNPIKKPQAKLGGEEGATL
jgi:hypothetical protein